MVPRTEYSHILHNILDRCLPREQEEPGEEILMPSASELHFAGVEFVPDAGDNLFKFKFKFGEYKGLFGRCRRARFVIPPLVMNDDTELYIRNLIVFEQYCPGVSENITSYAFVKDMLVNSDRDIQVLEKAKGQETDPIFGNSMTVYTVENDLVLLENQIPFFVLEKLFQLTVGRIPDRSDNNWSLTNYVWGCYEKKVSPVGDSTNARTWCSPSEYCVLCFGDKQENSARAKKKVLLTEYYHILHYIHDRCLPREQEEPGEVILMPSASELHFAGVEFVPDGGDNLFKFKFSKYKGLFGRCRRARLVIPPLVINDDTELYLRNLIAFEQYCPGISENITSYAFVMDMLVNSDKDIQVLEKAKVMRNYLGASRDATNLFNRLCKETALGEFVFAETCNRANDYSKSFWPQHMAHLRRTYFASPWTFIAFCVGFMAFVISLVEFVRSFLKKE
ncbi:hypothetical protein RHMOL_Rhmol05G0296500 [Rhododendron molle]|uniref:Uncharacterized protein n=1 Tax=Rhododendron molle TaxID=49168 RepID=A0ACC0NUQ4_RHOML|nr:hypothetical protein RHMOL_Rhmol05G0296500 [Rhododendron molle]